MTQGWHNDDYLIIFDEEAEAQAFADRYEVKSSLSGYTLVGLRGWDDFILRDTSGVLFTVPTVPAIREHIRQISWKIDPSMIAPDSRFTDRIKWYIQPIVFGGDASSEHNITWVTFDQHTELVKWWNNKYRELTPV
jgi:hypothetical protein